MIFRGIYMNIPYVMKRCTKCSRWLVASTVNFHRAKKGKYGLEAQCKECRSEKRKRYYETNRNKIAEKQRQYYETNKERKAEYGKQYREANKDKRAEYYKQYREANKDKIAERHRLYYKNNKEKLLDKKKQYCESNKEKISEYHKQYYQNNKEKVSEYHKQYYEANREKINERHRQYNKQYNETLHGKVVVFNRNNKRRLKEQEQGTGITKDQWLEMMKFFDFRCAYSGETLTKDTRSVDHVVPLNSNGDNMIWNCVPMTRSLNSSKSTKDMLEWYKEQDCYSEARLAKIYEWQEYAFNKYYLEEEC